MTNTLVYIDEEDRSYGLSGMAIALSLYNNEEKIMEINIDRYPDPIDFTPDFYFNGNPRCSAKVVWDEMAQNFHLALAMALGNLFSRRMIVGNKGISDSEEQFLRNLVEQEGADICGLEPDEIEAIWTKDYSYIRRIFSHPLVRSTTKELAAELRKRRIMSRHELIELLMKMNR